MTRVGRLILVRAL